MSKAVDYHLICDSCLGEELDDQECKVLADIMAVRDLHDGDLLVMEGTPDHHLYVLVDGKLTVASNVEGKDIVVYTMRKGECAGTRAFVDRTPRKATLRAIGDATVCALDPDAFESLLDDHPRIVYKVMRVLFRITHSNLMRMNFESRELTNYITKTHGRY